jgi:curved DNA-binding protein CbpA
MTRPKFDPYVVLGVTQESTNAQIQQAFRRLVPMYHPDTRNSELNKTEADETLRRVIVSFNLLRDEQNRRLYQESFVDESSETGAYYTQVLDLRPDELSLLKRMENMWSHGESKVDESPGLDIKIRYKETNIDTNPAEERHYYVKFGDKGYVDLHSLKDFSGTSVTLDQKDKQDILVLRELFRHLEGLSYSKSEFDRLGKEDETFGRATFFSDQLANFLLSRRYADCRQGLLGRYGISNTESEEQRYWSFPLDSDDNVRRDIELYFSNLSNRLTYKEAPLAQNHYDEAPLVDEGQLRRSSRERIQFG